MDYTNLESTMADVHTRHIIISVCDINQWSMDFQGNFERIRKTIIESKRQGASYRVGPELETCGYSCGDHLLELDTLHHNYEIIAAILKEKEFYDIVIDIGCFIHHNGVRYNARAICLNGKIICMRPKTVLANDGYYYENRWFTPWKRVQMEEWLVPPIIYEVSNQKTLPIGVCLLQFNDTCIASEICEELFIPNNIHQIMVLNGAEIITNGSGSHFQRGKLKNRYDLVTTASKRCGCAYVYSNLVGCDGTKLYFDGGSFISSCGKILNYSSRFELTTKGYNVISAYIDLDEVKAKRSSVMSWANVAAASAPIPRIRINKKLCIEECISPTNIYPALDDEYVEIVNHFAPIEELIYAPVCWLWDYLIRSGLSGFFLPVSGGADSSAVASLVYLLCDKIFEIYIKGDKNSKKILKIIRKIFANPDYTPNSVRDLCKNILVTSYLPSDCSSVSSKEKVEAFVNDINSTHYEVNIQNVCDSIISSTQKGMNFNDHMKFKSQGGSEITDLALQNVQSRVRMVMANFLSLSYISTKIDNKNSGNLSKQPLLVLGSGNADEIIVGYFTKYDCSSADLNLVGDIGKKDIFNILAYAKSKFGFNSLNEIIAAKPSAELVPLSVDGVTIQTDEADLGLSYNDIRIMRELRKNYLYGPLSMFRRLAHYYLHERKETGMIIDDVAEKVKRFFRKYAQNRHKSTILPPTIYMDTATCDDKGADVRPFLYNILYEWQFKCIDAKIIQYSIHKKNLECCKQ